MNIANFLTVSQTGDVLILDKAGSHSKTKFTATNEQANHDIMQLGGLGEADRFAHQAFDPGAKHQVFAFDLLGIALAGAMFLRR
jgi:hypothetical protein